MEVFVTDNMIEVEKRRAFTITAFDIKFCEQYERVIHAQTSISPWFYSLQIPMWIKIVVVWFIARGLLIPVFTWGYRL